MKHTLKCIFRFTSGISSKLKKQEQELIFLLKSFKVVPLFGYILIREANKKK